MQTTSDDHIYTVKEISLIGECVRKWSAKYLHRLHDPKHPAAAAGIDLHHILEQMLRKGPAANANPESEVGGWARGLYPHAPRGAHAELEQGFVIDFGAEQFRSSFRIDFVFPDFSGFGDWKSCAGPKWALAGPDANAAQQQSALAGDLQANLESYGFCRTMGKSAVDLQWVYVNKRTPSQTWSVRGRLTLLQAEAWLHQHAHPRMRLIRALRALDPKPAVQAVPHEITACDGSGRMCSFLGACQFQPSTIGLTTERLYQLVR